MYLYFSSSEVGLFHQAAAWLPFHCVSVLQPAERHVLILVRSRALAYYLCPNAARLGNGAETFIPLEWNSCCFSGVFFVFFFFSSKDKGACMPCTLIRRSSPGCIRCPAAQHIVSQNKRWSSLGTDEPRG